MVAHLGNEVYDKIDYPKKSFDSDAILESYQATHIAPHAGPLLISEYPINNVGLRLSVENSKAVRDGSRLPYHLPWYHPFLAKTVMAQSCIEVLSQAKGKSDSKGRKRLPKGKSA
ncbi:hypothetical protein Ddye_028983 [Dipteronia dyeriana]|uniref:Uncharacterized protein n=1 Tax=Dipteronia dyeriana TaxID=168575 RepID=A0AAD9TED7_9ROSI|nr:hypothetical protein Ddye_028983 [Dipteronia dyeriana]